MIKGRGLLGSALTEIECDDFLFYANGISNSVLQEIPNESSESKEIKRFAEEYQDKIFVYFSSCQVNSPQNFTRPYVQHKLAMEEFVQGHFERYLIVRASNLVGANPWNEHTLFNYLFRAVKNLGQIRVNPGVKRNFLDVAHFVSMLQTFLHDHNGNETIELVNPRSYTMQEILTQFEEHFSTKFLVEEISKTGDFALFELNEGLSELLFSRCSLTTENYIPTLLSKYYPLSITN